MLRYVYKTEDLDEETKMAMERDYPYLDTEVTIYPRFWTLNERYRRIQLCHEVRHLMNWRLIEFRLADEKTWDRLEEESNDRDAVWMCELLDKVSET